MKRRISNLLDKEDAYAMIRISVVAVAVLGVCYGVQHLFFPKSPIATTVAEYYSKKA